MRQLSLTSVQEVVANAEIALFVAEKGFPFGAEVQCKLCGYHSKATTEQVAEFLSAWPWHCGHRMEIDAVT